MSTTSTSTAPGPDLLAAQPPAPPEPEERLTIDRVSWDQYVQINDAIVERSNPRMIYCQGRLTLVGKSRLHEWLADCLGVLVRVLAARLKIECEPSGETTFRKHAADAGLEGDRTFHFGANAVHMRGPKNVDLSVDPPPDLAIEVEVTHSAARALDAWWRLGVPEVWRFDANTWTCTIWRRDPAGGYAPADRSRFLPTIEPAEIVAQTRTSLEKGSSEWLAGLESWIDTVVRPRSGQATGR